MLAGARPPIELIHEYGRIAGLEWINEADAPGVDARTVCADAQAEEVLEARVVERTECLRVLDSHACEQRQVGTEDPGCAGYFLHPPHDRTGTRSERDLNGAAAIAMIARVLTALVRRIRGVVAGIARRLHAAVREATRPKSGVVVGLAADVLRSRDDLVAENALLRQQLIVAARARTRATFEPRERALIVFCASVVRHWRSAVLLV
jgi:hypothetical protein